MFCVSYLKTGKRSNSVASRRARTHINQEAELDGTSRVACGTQSKMVTDMSRRSVITLILWCSQWQVYLIRLFFLPNHSCFIACLLRHACSLSHLQWFNISLWTQWLGVRSVFTGHDCLGWESEWGSPGWLLPPTLCLPCSFSRL